jgi:hypothetical protein
MVERMGDGPGSVPAPSGAVSWDLTGGGQISLADLRRCSHTLAPFTTLNDVAGCVPGRAWRVTYGQ